MRSVLLRALSLWIALLRSNLRAQVVCTIILLFPTWLYLWLWLGNVVDGLALTISFWVWLVTQVCMLVVLAYMSMVIWMPPIDESA